MKENYCFIIVFDRCADAPLDLLHEQGFRWASADPLVGAGAFQMPYSTVGLVAKLPSRRVFYATDLAAARTDLESSGIAVAATVPGACLTEFLPLLLLLE